MPDSASVTSSTALSIVSTRSASSAQSARASRAAAGGASSASAVSAEARRRVSGVRRSCATLSRASRMARSSAPFFSSTRLNCRASSASSLAACVSGTRSARLPVLMMARAVRSIPRTGLVERCANTAPTPRPSSSVGPMAADERDHEGPQQRRAAVRAAPDLQHAAVAQERRDEHVVAARRRAGCAPTPSRAAGPRCPRGPRAVGQGRGSCACWSHRAGR